MSALPYPGLFLASLQAGRNLEAIIIAAIISKILQIIEEVIDEVIHEVIKEVIHEVIDEVIHKVYQQEIMSGDISSHQGQKEGKKPFKEPKISWHDSKARELLYQDIMDGKVSVENERLGGTKLQEIYEMHQEYHLYDRTKFSSRVSILRKAIIRDSKRADQDSIVVI